ncbi:MAG: DUF1015 domain-containing protein [Dermatophilaceae bacterium]
MPRFEPFAALRYAPGTDWDAVIAPPYDVLSDAQVTALAARSRHNVVHIDVPSAPPGQDRYAVAARLLEDWVSDAILVADAEPSLTIYRMRFTDPTGADRRLVGVLGALQVVDEGAPGVLPHERTTPKASTDRLDLTRATRANLSPVWGLALAGGLTDLLAEPGEAMGSLVVDGVEHVAERVTDPARIAAIAAVVDSDDVLIADGHHRYGVARQYREEVRAATGRTDTPAESTLAFVNELVADQLSIDAIHRLVGGMSLPEIRATLARDFDLEPAPEPGPALLADLTRRGRLALLTVDGSAWWLVPKAAAFDGIRDLDGAWLEHTFAGTPATLDYQHGLAEVQAALADGRAEAAILIRPTSLAEIERTAREGLLMPPKSTFFTPKLRTGLVLRPLG